jgi:hypothetical protein
LTLAVEGMAYYELPRKLEDYLVFMELNLQS